VLRQERKSNKPGYEVLTEAKKVWEKLRRGDIKRDEKQKLMKEIMEMIEGRVGDVSVLYPGSQWFEISLLTIPFDSLFSSMMLLESFKHV
jgi:pumilio family protein 6